ncbi:fumarylacetoacetate hydrolase family protein [Cysteiniphilum sp. 6C5]|uniref:fumarylacetoacetate hydrolase family protein n=1 Tax=unclassified Cysteiniphilum TaxID=2610889 RepID=UPI003F8576EB
MHSIAFNNKIVFPSKIVCVGRNYLNHIKELNNEMPEEPVLFIKPNSAISNTLAIDPKHILHYETELCLLIESQKIAGVGLGLDLTDRNLQSELKQKGLPWEKAKSFDGAAVFSEFIPLENIKDLADLSFKLMINGGVKQHGLYEHMLYKPESLVQYIQTYFSLNDHDIVMTGTPEGVGEVKLNDVFELSLYLKEKVVLKRKYLVSNR